MSEIFSEKIKEARLAYDGGNFNDASRLYLQALGTSPDNKNTAMIWAELCWTFYKLKSFQQAIEAGENVLTYNAGYAARVDIYRLMGYSAGALGETDTAISYLQRSLEIDNASDKQQYIHYELAKLYFHLQDYTLVLNAFDKVDDFLKSHNPDYWVSSLFIKGFANYYLSKTETAAQIFKMLSDNAPDAVSKANGLYGQAYLAFDKKEYLETINLCENITKIQAEFFDKESLGFLMAASFFHLGRIDVFEQYYHQMEKNYPKGRYHNELKKLHDQSITVPPPEASSDNGKPQN